MTDPGPPRGTSGEHFPAFNVAIRFRGVKKSKKMVVGQFELALWTMGE
jgi:hypothetical protein